MAFVVHVMSIVCASVAFLSRADELAWGDVTADGLMEMRSLDVPVATARGAENLFISNPMDSHDWARTSVVRNSMNAELNGSSAKVQRLEEALRPIFSVMPKDSAGRLNNATARYALHRLFNQRHGWSIKGLEPAGASWQAGLSVTPDVKDIIKYMLPSYLQQLLAQRGVAGYDLHSLAVFAAVIEHMIHAEMITIVYSVFTTLELPVPGKKSGKELRDILDTFLMVFAFGINLDVSVLEDVRKTKAYLETSHSGWPQLQSFAREVEQKADMGLVLDFTEIVQLAEKMGEGYANWQGKDCLQAKEELMAMPSHREGYLKFSEVKPSHISGRRSLFTEDSEDLQMLGVLSGSSRAESQQLIIPNYLNSQSMCLSTASLYTVCCANECDNLLRRLEREVAAPAADPAELKRLVCLLPGPGVAEPLLQELPGLVDSSSGLIPLHGRQLASWMHRAFPLECPAPSDHKITNPKTPDEWMGDSGQEVKELENMIAEIAEVLNKYTTMGTKGAPGQFKSYETSAPDASTDVVTIKSAPVQQETRGSAISTVFRFTAMVSMLVVVAFAAKPVLQATNTGITNDKLEQSFV